jgi:hypothetical protein
MQKILVFARGTPTSRHRQHHTALGSRQRIVFVVGVDIKRAILTFGAFYLNTNVNVEIRILCGSMDHMNPTIPYFGALGWNTGPTGQGHVLPNTNQPYTIAREIKLHADQCNVIKMTIMADCLYERVPQQLAQLNDQNANKWLASLKTELPLLIGAEVEKRVKERMDSQQLYFESENASLKETMLANKSNSIVTLNGSILGLGKITEAYTKTIEALQAVGKAWNGAAGAASNVDNVSFPLQLGRSMLNGAKGSLKITAGALGAAVVMAALLATSGMALNKVHQSFPSVPSASSIVSGVTGQAEKLKVTVGSVEVERAGGEVKTLSVQERATALLEANGHNVSAVVKNVKDSLTLAYIDGAPSDTISKKKELLQQLESIQTSTPPHISGVAVPAVTAGTAKDAKHDATHVGPGGMSM